MNIFVSDFGYPLKLRPLVVQRNGAVFALTIIKRIFGAVQVPDLSFFLVELRFVS